MFGNLLGGLVDKNKIVNDYIKDSLINLSEELQCNYNELCVIIKPKNENMDFDFFLCRFSKEEGVSAPIRKVSLKEILGDDDDDEKNAKKV